MRDAARVWLEYADLDLRAARLILDDATLTSVVAFHAQQAIEKLLKALLEEKEVSIPKTHDLERLYSIAQNHWAVEFDEDLMRLIATLYIDSRYPAELGLLPGGRPSETEAQSFVGFAEVVRGRVEALLRRDEEVRI